MSRQETATAAPEFALFDAIDLPGNEATGEGGVLVRAGQLQNFPGGGACILSTSVGAPGFYPYLGRYWFGVNSSGSGGKKSREATSSRIGVWPMGASTAGFSADGTLPCVYEFTINVLRTTPLIPDVAFGLALVNSGAGALSLFSMGTVPNTVVGVEISSQPSVNAGNWTAYDRIVGGGALTATDLGIHPSAGIARLGFRYYHRGTPRFEFLFNGVAVRTLDGLAAVPDFTTAGGGSPVQQCGVVQNQPMPYAGGQLDYFVQGRITISRLPGFGIPTG